MPLPDPGYYAPSPAIMTTNREHRNPMYRLVYPWKGTQESFHTSRYMGLTLL